MPPNRCQFTSSSEHSTSGRVGSPAILDSASSEVFNSVTSVETADISPTLLRDLELMHYYTAFTCLTISDLAAFKQIWQEIVPREAQSHHFLMYGILALAALHIGHDRSQSKGIYTAVARRHYNAAIASFRAALKRVTPDNSNALFAFSAILIVLSLAFAQSHPPAETHNAVEELIQIFTLLQGVRVVLQSAMPWVAQGPLSPLLRRGVISPEDIPMPSPGIPPDFDEALIYLEGCNERMSENADDHEMYNVAIQALRGSLEKIEANPRDRAAALNWLVFLESSYVSSLMSKKPFALVILAHYCVILDGLREHWFVQDWGVRVIEVVHANLSEEWRSLVHWPMKQIGLRAEPPLANKAQKPD